MYRYHLVAALILHQSLMIILTSVEIFHASHQISMRKGEVVLEKARWCFQSSLDEKCDTIMCPNDSMQYPFAN